MSSLSKYFLVSIGEDVDVGRVLCSNTTFVQSAYALYEKEQPTHLQLPAVLRLLLCVEPAKRQRRIFNFFSRTKGLDVRQCSTLSSAAAAMEYAGKNYVLVLGTASSEIETPLPATQHTTPAATINARSVNDEVSRAIERLQNIEASTNHSQLTLLAAIDNERCAHQQTREVLLELMYVCGEHLDDQASALGMALALDCFMIESNNSTLPCCADTMRMIEQAIAEGSLDKLSFRQTLQMLHYGVVSDVWGAWIDAFSSPNTSAETPLFLDSDRQYSTRVAQETH